MDAGSKQAFRCLDLMVFNRDIRDLFAFDGIRWYSMDFNGIFSDLLGFFGICKDLFLFDGIQWYWIFGGIIKDS